MTEIAEEEVKAPEVEVSPKKERKAPILKDAISKRNKISHCDCEEGPTRVPFLLFSPQPFNTFEGEKCDKCQTILSYKAVRYEKNKEGRFLAAYEIARISAGKKPEVVTLTCKFKVDQGFNVEMTSTPEKVTKALANPVTVNGKYAVIEFDSFSSEGMPIKGSVVTVRNKADIGIAIEEAKKKQAEIK